MSLRFQSFRNTRVPHLRLLPVPEPLLDLFPASEAPPDYSVASGFEVVRQFAPWESASNWHPALNEADVPSSIRHKSVEARAWEMKIGKGGPIYSIFSSFGEAMPPRPEVSAWVNEIWRAVILDTEKLGQQDIALTGANFVHQSGIYVNTDRDPVLSGPFYSPLLSQDVNDASRSYTVLNWGQIADAPSIHRAGALFYTRLRDLGEGVIEATWLVYNFGDDNFNDLACPWGGVRTSVFPELVLSRPDGTPRFYTPWGFGYPGSHVAARTTGGWAAATTNAADPDAYALGLVFGLDSTFEEQMRRKQEGDDYYQFGEQEIYSSGNEPPRAPRLYGPGSRI